MPWRRASQPPATIQDFRQLLLGRQQLHLERRQRERIGNGGAGTSGVSNLGLANMPAPDSLQEFKIDSGNQNAEYRDVATVTMVTKQGTNAFHGLAYEYLENTELNANSSC